MYFDANQLQFYLEHSTTFFKPKSIMSPYTLNRNGKMMHSAAIFNVYVK